MQQVHKLSSGRGDGTIPVATEPEAVVVTDEFDPACGVCCVHERRHIGPLGGVVHHADLHLVSGRCLRQHRRKRPVQFFIRLVRRQHHGEPRIAAVRSRGRNNDGGGHA